MKKLTIFLLFVTICGLGSESFAQQRTIRSKNRLDRNILAPSIGLKGGVTMYNYLYTDFWYEGIEQELMQGTMFGMVVENPYNKWVSFSAELMKVGRGTSFSYIDRVGDTVNYAVNANYLDLRLPVFLKVNITNWFQPFIFGGVDLAYNFGGLIHIKQNIYGAGYNNGIPTDDPTIADFDPENGFSVYMGRANMAPFTASVFAGGGLRFNIFFKRWSLIAKVSADYNYGLLNTFSKMELNHEAQGVNANAYKLYGKRVNMGMEINASLALPLEFVDKACSDWRNHRDQFSLGIFRR